MPACMHNGCACDEIADMLKYYGKTKTFESITKVYEMYIIDTYCMYVG